MSFLGLARRMAATTAKPAAAAAAASLAVVGAAPARELSTSLFSSSKPLFRSSYVAPLTKGDWRVSNKRHRKGTKVVRGILNDEGKLEVPSIRTEAEAAAEKAAIRSMRPTRTVFPLRKVFLRNKYRDLFDKAQLMVVLHSLDSTSFELLKNDVSDHFTSAHLCTGLIQIQDKPYANLVNLLRSTARVLYLTDASKVITGLAALNTAVKAYPNLLFLGGMVQGATVTSYQMEELLQFQSIEQVKGTVIPYLSAPAQIIPALQSPSMQLIQLLQHHSKVLGGAGAEGAAAPA